MRLATVLSAILPFWNPHNQNLVGKPIQLLVPYSVAGNLLIVESRRWSVNEHPDGMGIENRDNHFRVAVRGNISREIHLPADSEFILPT